MENNQTPSKALGIVGLIFGICSLVLCWLGFVGGIFGIIPIVLGILAIIFCASTQKKFKAVGQKLGMAKAGLILAIIGLVISVIATIVGIACTAAVAVAAQQDPSVADALNELANELEALN